MRKLLVVSYFALLAFPLIAVTVFAKGNFEAREVVRLEKGERIERDYFAWGEKVIVSGTIEGDAYLAGGAIVFDGTVNGDLLVAGGTVQIMGEVRGDLRVVGGNVTLSGAVRQNVTAGGGTVNVVNSARIGGNLVAAGGDVQVYAPVAGGATFGAESLTLGSAIAKDVAAGVGELSLTSGAKLGGAMAYWSDRPADIAQGATISGEVTHHPLAGRGKGRAAGFAILGAISIFGFFSNLLVGLVIAFLTPQFMHRATEHIRKTPWRTAWVGFLALAATPVALVILAATVVGIPIALLYLVVYLFILFFAAVFVAPLVGGKILDVMKSKRRLPLALAIGLLILTIVRVVPFIGWIVGLAVTILGVGAYVRSKGDLLRDLRQRGSL